MREAHLELLRSAQPFTPRAKLARPFLSPLLPQLPPLTLPPLPLEMENLLDHEWSPLQEVEIDPYDDVGTIAGDRTQLVTCDTDCESDHSSDVAVSMFLFAFE